MEQWREDILIHYGILGMKWGIRRYQPYSVKPRKSGKGGKEVGEASKGGSNGSKSKSFKSISNTDFLTYDKLGEDKSRTKKACDVGLKALDNMNLLNWHDGDSFNNDDRLWFLYEDQTICLPIISDLVNQGASKKQILALVDEANNADFSKHYTEPYFYLSENLFGNGKFLEEYIDQCKKVNGG